MSFNAFSNQQVINAFYYAARKLNAADGQARDAWNLISDAHLQDIANQRHVVYSGKAIDQLPLPQDMIDAVVAELAAMTPEFQNSSTATVPDVMLNVPWVSQLDADSPEGLDCGQACVLMLLRYYDNPPSPTIISNITVEDLVELMRDIDVRNHKPRRAKNTTNGEDLVELAAANGLTLRCNVPFMQPSDAIAILDDHRPIIALVNYKDLHFPLHLSTDDQGMHWLVIIGYADGGKTFIVNDPLWTRDSRGTRGGGGLTISAANLKNALRLRAAVH